MLRLVSPQDWKYIAVPIVFVLKEVVNGALFTTISLEFCPSRAVALSNSLLKAKALPILSFVSLTRPEKTELSKLSGIFQISAYRPN